MSVEITKHLQAWQNGNAAALNEILPAVYDELYRIARRYRSKEFHNHTLQTSEIISEAYLELFKHNETDWQNRSHFFV